MARNGRSDLVDIPVHLHAETDKAWMIRTGDRSYGEKHWIPKSQGELVPEGSPGIYILTIPEWLAVAKGLDNDVDDPAVVE